MFTVLLFLLPTLLLGYGIYELVDDENGDGDETLTGNDQPNDIDGKNGNDLISGLGGNDNIEGGSGADVIDAGDGDDVVLAQQNDDSVDGGAGDDLLLGGQGSDTVAGGAGEDWIEGNAGTDTLNGGGDSDLLIGGAGADVANGGAGDDIVFGGNVTGTPLNLTELKALRDGTSLADILDVDEDSAAVLRDDGAADTLSGGAGDDLLILGAGDEVTGDDGADIFAILADQVGRDDMAGDAPFGGTSVITDYSSEDSLVVIGYEPTPPTITITVDGDDALVMGNGEFLARVTGAGPTLMAEDISIIPAPLISGLDPNT